MSRYPSEPELKAIKKWKLETWQDFQNLAKFIVSIWEYADMDYATLHGNTLKLSTGGWSGNESIMSALEVNRKFGWCWKSSKRGGHYVYKLPIKKNFKNKNDK